MSPLRATNPLRWEIGHGSLHRVLVWALAGALVGLAVFFYVIGLAPLKPTEIDWVFRGDVGFHYLAWAFLRQEPWSFPLGQMERFGAELASTITFADGIPVMALPMKLLSPWLPQDFQFFGIWALICFVLQGAAGALLLGRFTQRIEVILAAAAFFALQPVMVFRFGLHFALMGQWLISAALLVFLFPTSRRALAGWMLILLCGALTHAYLLAMVLGFFVVWSGREMGVLAWNRAWGDFLRTGIGIGIVWGVLVTGMASLDYFRPMQLGQSRFRDYSANLLGWLLPTEITGLLLPPHRQAYEIQFEGFWYLGAGAVFLVVAAFIALLLRFRSVREMFCKIPRAPWVWWSFAGTMLAFGMLASGLSITVGPHLIWEVPLPTWGENLMNIFRTTGRFAWPVATGVLFVALVTIASLPRWMCAVVVLAGLWLQLAEVPRFREHVLAERLEPTGVAEFPKDARWKEFLPAVKGISVLPEFFWRFKASEMDLGLLAVRNGLVIDAVDYGRFPQQANLEPRWQRFHGVWRGRPQSGWLYVIHRGLLERKNLAAWRSLLPCGTKLLRMDGYYVVALTESGQPVDWGDWNEFAGEANWYPLDFAYNPVRGAMEGFDSLFLGGFYPDERGAMLSYDEGVMAFALPQGARKVGLLLALQSGQQSRDWQIKLEWMGQEGPRSERQEFLKPGWQKAEVSVEVAQGMQQEEKGILRLTLHEWNEKRAMWQPKKGGSVRVEGVLVE